MRILVSSANQQFLPHLKYIEKLKSVSRVKTDSNRHIHAKFLKDLAEVGNLLTLHSIKIPIRYRFNGFLDKLRQLSCCTCNEILVLKISSSAVYIVLVYSF